jgi:hypothetical protein
MAVQENKTGIKGCRWPIDDVMVWMLSHVEHQHLINTSKKEGAQEEKNSNSP